MNWNGHSQTAQLGTYDRGWNWNRVDNRPSGERDGKRLRETDTFNKKQIDEMTIRVRVNIKNGEKDDGRAG